MGQRSNASSSVIEMQKSSIPLRKRRSQLSKNPILAKMRFIKPNQSNVDAIEELKKIQKKHKSSIEVNRKLNEISNYSESPALRIRE